MSLTGAQRDRLESVIDGILVERQCQLVAAAQAVVDARYSGGGDGWERLKEAVGLLENIVGRRT